MSNPQYTAAARKDAGGRTMSQVIDSMPRVGLSKGASFALFCAFFFSNYEIGVFALVIPGLRNNLGMVAADFTWPVVWNLLGYAAGAYAFGYLADKLGRQLGLRLTFITLGIGGLLSGFSWDVASFSFFRFLAGCGMGAVLAICAAYIGEVSPANQRGRYLARIYVIQSPLLLVVGLASLPVLSALPDTAWRYLLAVGGLVLLVVPLINKKHVIESPRWLEERGRHAEARNAVSQLCVGAGGAELAPNDEIVQETKEAAPVGPLKTLAASGLLPRLFLVLSFWFIFYIGMYGFLSYQTLLLEGLGITTSNALFINVLGRLMPIIAALGVFAAIERFERRNIVITGVLVVAVSVLLMTLGWGEWAATTGSLGATLGVSLMVTPAYTYTAEVFPTSVRGTAASICDGIGHLGGAVAPLVVIPILASHGAAAACWAIIVCLVISAAILRAGVKTKNRALEEIAA